MRDVQLELSICNRFIVSTFYFQLLLFHTLFWCIACILKLVLIIFIRYYILIQYYFFDIFYTDVASFRDFTCKRVGN